MIKQDCETAAAKRWLDKEAARYLASLNHNVTYLGDDLYAHQPFCRRVLLQRSHFIFTCKPDSHTHLYPWIGLLEQGRDLRTITMRVKGRQGPLGRAHLSLRQQRPADRRRRRAQGQLVRGDHHRQAPQESLPQRLGDRLEDQR